MEHDFPTIGYKVMVLNARKVEEQNLILLAIEDVTEKWEADQKFKEMVNSVHDYAIFHLNVDFNITTWNEGCERVHGWKAEEVVGKNFALFHTPEDIESGKVEAAKQRVRREGTFSEEGMRVRADGTGYLARVAMTAIRNKAGEITGYAMVVQDIHEWKKTLDLIQAITDNASTAIFMMDHTGVTTFMNPAAEGAPRTLLAGIKQHYEIPSLIDRQIVVVCNLPPRTMKGVESHGMLLAAKSGDTLGLLSYDRRLPAGTVIG